MKLLANREDYLHKDQVEECVTCIVCVIVCLSLAAK